METNRYAIETPWFQKTSPVSVPLKAPAPEPPSTDERRDDEKEQPEARNAFHLISLSEGFNLSLLFGSMSCVGSILSCSRHASRRAACSVAPGIAGHRLWPGWKNARDEGYVWWPVIFCHT
jgi:hypothetical protein